MARRKGLYEVPLGRQGHVDEITPRQPHGSLLTPRWRKPDSNRRYRVTQARFREGLMSPQLDSPLTEKSARTRTDTRTTTGAFRGTDGSNPLPSRSESLEQQRYPWRSQPPVTAGRRGREPHSNGRWTSRKYPLIINSEPRGCLKIGLAPQRAGSITDQPLITPRPAPRTQ
jgi:hypothetical protein